MSSQAAQRGLSERSESSESSRCNHIFPRWSVHRGGGVEAQRGALVGWL